MNVPQIGRWIGLCVAVSFLALPGCNKKPVAPAPPVVPPVEPVKPDTTPKALRGGRFSHSTVRTEPSWVDRRGVKAWVQQIDVGRATARFALQVRVLKPVGTGPISLVVRDSTGVIRPVTNTTFVLPQSVGDNSLVQTPDYILGDFSDIQVTVLGFDQETNPPPVRVEGVAITRQRRDVEPEGVNPDWSPIWRNGSAEIQRYGQSLARLTIRNNYCSGFAVSADLLVTNNHCISELIEEKQDVCSVTSIGFNFVDAQDAGGTNWATCVGVVATDADLDYAILRFKPVNRTVTIPPLRISRMPPDKKVQNIQVVHHPRGQVSQYSTCEGALEAVDIDKKDTKTEKDGDPVQQQRQDCGLNYSEYYRPLPSHVAHSYVHKCDTAPGSSGAPIIVNGAVVGLHFSWDNRYYDPDGSLNEPYDAEQCVVDHLNLGNWFKDVCTVLADAALKAPSDGIPQCQ
jgi:hypothetical protein